MFELDQINNEVLVAVHVKMTVSPGHTGPEYGAV
jgi:hypothetical protein